MNKTILLLKTLGAAVIFIIALSPNALQGQNCTDPACISSDSGNGPDPCFSKLYCSNNNTVNGFLACTTAADTDGCGIDASISTIPTTGGDLDMLLNQLNDDCYETGWNVQWIRFFTDNNVNQIKVQGVGGALDSYAIYWNPNWDSTTDPTANDPDLCDDPLNEFELIGSCITANQYQVFTNMTTTTENNLYYIAMIYEDTGNSSINFKSKECLSNITSCEPQIICPDDETIECGNTTGVNDWLASAGGDNCGADFDVTNDFNADDFTLCSATGTVAVTFTLVDDLGDEILDASGDPITCTANLTIDDSTAPSISCPSNLTLDCDDNTQPPSTGVATATDDCDSDVVPSFNDVVTPGDCSQESIITRTWTATDDCGNTNTCVQIITISDETNPSITCPGDMDIFLQRLECETQVQWTVSANDACSGALTPVQTEGLPTNSFFNLEDSPYTISYEATDECGNTASCSFDINIIEFQVDPPTNQISCNGIVSSSYDSNCEILVTPLMIINGLDYGCVDDYIVMVKECEDCDPIPSSPIITGEYLGDTLVVELCDDDPINPNCCWGYIIPEDYLNPTLCCSDFSIGCTTDINPENLTGLTNTYEYEGAAISISESDNDTIEIEVECDTIEILDLNINLNISHDNLSEVSVTLIGPDGTAAAVSLPTPTNLPGFAGKNASGIWQIIVTDNTANGITGTLNSANLEIEADYANPIALDNCDVDLSPTYTDVFSDTDCNSDCYQTITRTWCVTDDSENETCCTQTICLTRPDLEDLVCPPSYDGFDEDPLSCTDEYPDPDNTGRPQLEGTEISDFCMFYCIYEDAVIEDLCGGGYIVIRDWTCYDWCNGEEETCQQVIKLMDTEAPIIIPPNDIEVSTGQLTCTASAILPNASISDDCSLFSTSITADNGTIQGNAIFDLPIGVTTVTITATDECNNTSSETYTITVEDLFPPTPICETNHTVALTSDEPTLAPAISFDDGSIDACGPLTFRVRRMEGTDCTFDDATTFGEFAPFYCCDLMETIQVELEITDGAGNKNFCMKLVTVQDNLDPQIACPSNKIIDCDDSTDPLNTGFPVVVDNCTAGIPTYSDVGSIDCNGGTITRTWIVLDGSGNSNSCVQTITANPGTPYVINDTNCNDEDPNDGVIWPCTLESVDFCVVAGIAPTPIQLLANGYLEEEVRPQILANSCLEDNILYSYEDSNPITGPDFCMKFERVWKVFNCCSIPHVLVGEYSQFIKINTSAPPTVSCGGITPAIVGDPSTVIVTASDDCTPFTDLIITYEVDEGNSGTFDPPVFGTDASGIYPLGESTVKWTVTDECGTISACLSSVVVNPPEPTSFNVSGGIENEEGEEVEYVMVEITGDMNEEEETGNDGVYSFDLPVENNYTVTPERNDNPLNGVSTFDLVKISQHILDVEVLATPYKIIAADVNNSGNVSTLDLVELRKLILFIDTEFSNNTSWRFVDADFVFPNPSDPFQTSFPEVYTINDLSENMLADFIGIKVGDVNCSATANDFAGSSDDRNNGESLNFFLEDQSLKTGQTYTFNFDLKDVTNLQGYQFSLAFDQSALAFESTIPGEFAGMNESNFGMSFIDQGIITSSWHTTDMLDIEKATSFSLRFTALKDAQLSDLININSRYTKAQAYLNHEFSDVSIAFESENGIALNHFQLFQNRPNPFKGTTVISFNLPQKEVGFLTIYDLSGRVIEVVQGEFNEGYNEVDINSADLSGHGVFYYQLEVANHTATRKMVLLK